MSGAWRSSPIYVWHGQAAGGKVSVEYGAWAGMLGRCLSPTNTRFHYYGGRGILVCDQWVASFAKFLEDVGRRPSARHSIDRINVNGNYEPGNVRWATREEQAQNKRIQSNNKTGTSGVYAVSGNRYRAQISVNGKRLHVGRFASLQEAISARRKAEVQYWGRNHG